MRRIIVLLITLLIFTVPLAAGEGDKTSFSIGTGPFVSNLGIGRDLGQFEVGGNIYTGFPNLFIWTTIDNPENVWENLKGSLTLAAGGDIYGRYDLFRSLRHDLDIGPGIAFAYLNVLDNNVVSAFLELSSRYTFNFSNGGGIFLEANLPIATYMVNLSAEGGPSGSFSLLFGEGVLSLTALFCTRVGYIQRF